MKQKNSTPLKPNDVLRRHFHDFVGNVLAHAEDPANWPLTQQEQVAFIREVMYQARKIRNTEEYLAEACVLAAEDLALAS